MQNGQIKQRGQSWVLRYWETVLVDGKPKKRRVLKRLAPICREFQTAKSVEYLAAEILAPINGKTARPAPLITLKEFVTTTYLPHCEAEKKPSTYQSYEEDWGLLSRFIEDRQVMREIRPSDVIRILKALADEKPRAQTTLNNCRNFLSGAFRHAIATDVYPYANPVTDVPTPKKGLPPRKQYAYSLEECAAIIRALPEPARTVVMMAAFSGLRKCEIRGLKWADFAGDSFHVQRSVWGKHEGDTKTKESAAPVPLMPMLQMALAAHRKRQPEGEYVFAGERCGRPLNLQNLARRVIIPTLDKAGIEWHGWHAFRRGVSSSLNGLGVDDSVIQRILRHSDVQTTQRHYIKTVSSQAQEAMATLADAAKKALKAKRPRK